VTSGVLYVKKLNLDQTKFIPVPLVYVMSPIMTLFSTFGYYITSSIVALEPDLQL
jgi:hypothetical protein